MTEERMKEYFSKLEILCSPVTLYLFSTVLLVFLNLYYHTLFLPIRAIAGLLSLILIPGYLLDEIIFESGKKQLTRTFVTGLAWSILAVNCDFLLYTISGEGVPLLQWLILLNTTLVAALFASRPRLQSRELFLEKFENITRNRKLFGLMLAAFSVRALLAIVATGSLSPDGSLYAEYSRGIIEGRFDSRIIGDNSVLTVIGNAEQIVHQGVSHVFAISWLMAPPTSSGPIFLLIVEGTLLLPVVYQVACAFFSERTAFLITSVIGFHPLFVFHSVVAYGPEITSLLFLVCGAMILLRKIGAEDSEVLFAGVLIGLVEVIWYPNYYLACILIPVVIIYLKDLRHIESFLFLLAGVCLLAARAVYRILPLFYFCWGVVIASSVTAGKYSANKRWWKYLAYFSGILSVSSIWRLPQQLAVVTGAGTRGASLSEPILDILLSPSSIHLIGGFLLFIAIHVTIPILCMAIFSLRKTWKRKSSGIFVLLAILAAIGTYSVFSLIRNALEFQYLFSDSRFFLFITLMGILASGEFLDAVGSKNGAVKETESPSVFMHRRKAKLVVFLLILGMIPGYLAVPSGVGLTQFETKYGWSGLKEVVAGIGNEDSIFLVDRAREFSWYTSRCSMVLEYSDEHLPDIQANNETMQLASEGDTEYIVIDDYFVARWQTLNHLYQSELNINDRVILETSGLANESASTMRNVAALKFVASTRPNQYGRYARIFGFDKANYTIKGTENILGDEWQASNNGSIVSEGGKPNLVIGSSSNYTNTWRPEAENPLCYIQSGFVVIRLSNMTADVARVGILNTEGELVDYAEAVDDHIYCSIVGGVFIGDIRIVIEGEPGDSITIDRIGYWDEVNDV